MELSIIIPVFNGEKYIKNCLDSILTDISDNQEVIVVNDGSTDNTQQILLDYKKKHGNISIYNNENHGVSYSRNYGIDVAKGEYIMFVDADDILSLGWNKKVNLAIKEKKDFIFFNMHEDLNNISKIELISYMFDKKKNIYLSTPWSKLFKLKIIKDNRIKFEKKLINGEDFIFNLQYFKCMNTFKVIKDNVYIYRLSTSNSLTKNFNINILNSDILFSKLLEKEIQMIPEFDSNNIVENEKYNGLYLILNRIMTNNTFGNSKKYLELIDRNYYNIKLNDVKQMGLKKFQIIIINCFLKKKYFTINLFFKILKMRKKLNKKEILIEI